MSSFTTELKISPIEGETNLFFLQEYFRYRIGNRGSKSIIEIPKGFVTNGASIPAIVQPILSPWGKYGKSACLHDYLYYTGILGTRKASDELMVEAMRVLNVPEWQIKVIYSALRIGGAPTWNKYRKEDFARIKRESLVGYRMLPINRERYMNFEQWIKKNKIELPAFNEMTRI